MANGYSVGQLVWAKFFGNHRAWPAMIIDSNSSGLMEKQGKLSVFWFGTHQVSLVPLKLMQNFSTFFEENIKGAIKKTLQKSITESVKVYAKRHYEKDLSDVGYEEAVTFMRNDLKNLGPPNDNFIFPNFVKDILEKYKTKNKSKKRALDRDLDQSVNINKITSKEDLMNAVDKKEIDLEEICIACFSDKNVLMHPFFKTGLCINCKKEYLKTVFIYCRTNFCKVHCYICGQDDNVTFFTGCFLWTVCKSCLSYYLNIDKQKQRNPDTAFITGLTKRDLMRKDDEVNYELAYLFREDNMLCPYKPFLKDFPFKQLIPVLCLSICHEKFYDTDYKENLRNNELFNAKKIEFKTLDDMKKDLITLDENETTIIFCQSCPADNIWFKNNEKNLTAKTILVEFFMEFYKFIEMNKSNIIWFYELPSSIEPDFRELISRFLKTYPYVVERLQHKHCKYFEHYNNFRLVWSNTTLELQHIKDLFKIIPIK